MELIPAVVEVENPGTGQSDVVTHARGAQVATIARHEFDNEVPSLLGLVHVVDESATGIQVDV
jgi:hypothetical protein